MVNEAAIKLALNDLNSQEAINFANTAKKYQIDRVTLMRRYKGKSTSNHEARSIHQKILTDAQEEVILSHISSLSDRGIPPTPQILENLVVEIARRPIRQYWIRRFCQRYKDEIKSIYLRGIDQTRKIADNSKYFEYFYLVVRAPYSLLST
jgi:hypothetical protein